MTEYISFSAVIEPLEWGDKTYTILRLPDDVVAALGSAKRYEGEINDHPVNLAPSRAPVIEGVFLWTGATLLRAIGVDPGTPLEVRLRPADPNVVDTPEDVLLALHQHDLTALWDDLTAGKRRGLLYQINTAKKAETRANRIAKLMQDLAHG